jgi:hypothetical protein
MKTWLQLTLVIVTVGGGFTLCAASVEMLLQIGPNRQTAAILTLIMIACSVFITASGLVFVYDPRRIRLAQIALSLQIPYISSSLFVYKLICGAGLYTVICTSPIEDLAAVFGHIGIRFQFGGYWSLAFCEDHPVGIGVNWVAIFLLLMVRHSIRAVGPQAFPVVLEPNTSNQGFGNPPEPQ